MGRICFKVRDGRERVKELREYWQKFRPGLNENEVIGHFDIYDEYGNRDYIPYLVKGFKKSVCIYVNKGDIPLSAKELIRSIEDAILHEVLWYLGLRIDEVEIYG